MKKSIAQIILLAITVMPSVSAIAEETGGTDEAVASTPAEYEKEFARLQKLKTCIEATRSANSRFKTMLDTWFDSNSSLDVKKNFEFLATQHEKHFEAINAIAVAAEPALNDIAGIATAIADLDTQHTVALANLTRMRQADELFVLSIWPINDGLGEVLGQFNAAKSLCEDEDQTNLDAVASSIKELRLQLLSMSAYVSEAAQKRSLLFRVVLEAKKLRLLKAYSEATRVPLETLLTSVTQILQADTLYGRIEEWWRAAAVTNGLGRGAVTKDLQYTEALRILKADWQVGQNFQRELLGLANLSPNVRQAIKGDLDLFVKQLADQIATLESSGYQAVLVRQKFMASKRREHLASYPAECKRALDVYELSLPKVTSVETFREAEEAYKMQVRACVSE